MSPLIPPYGGQLVNCYVSAERAEQLKEAASRLPSLQLSDRAVCHLELLATGAFSPPDRFMGQEDHRRVVEEMRLASGSIFSIPVTLSVNAGADIHLDQQLALRDSKNDLLAVTTVEEIYPWDRDQVGQKVFGTCDLRHPLVAEMQRWGSLNISGPLEVLQLPRHYDFCDLRLTPAETRAMIALSGRRSVVAFQTRPVAPRTRGAD